MKVDLTVLAIPAYAAAIGAEIAWQRAHPVEPGTRAGDYQTADTLASLALGAVRWSRRTSPRRCSTRSPRAGAGTDVDSSSPGPWPRC